MIFSLQPFCWQMEKTLTRQKEGGCSFKPLMQFAALHPRSRSRDTTFFLSAQNAAFSKHNVSKHWGKKQKWKEEKSHELLAEVISIPVALRILCEKLHMPTNNSNLQCKRCNERRRRDHVEKDINEAGGKREMKANGESRFTIIFCFFTFLNIIIYWCSSHLLALLPLATI